MPIRIQSKNLAWSAFCWISLACIASCFIKKKKWNKLRCRQVIFFAVLHQLHIYLSISMHIHVILNVYDYMYTYMYNLYVHIYMYDELYIHVYIYTCICISMCTCLQVRICLCIIKHTHTYIRTQTYRQTDVQTQKHTHTHMFAYSRIWAYMHRFAVFRPNLLHTRRYLSIHAWITESIWPITQIESANRTNMHRQIKNKYIILNTHKYKYKHKLKLWFSVSVSFSMSVSHTNRCLIIIK